MSTAKYFRPLRKMSYAATCLGVYFRLGPGAGSPGRCSGNLPGAGGNTKTIWGAGFMLGQTEVWDWKRLST